MKIFVTGSSGFLGKAFVSKGKQMGLDIIAPSSTELNLTNEAPNYPSCKFDAIVHFATWTRAGNFCKENTGKQWLINEKMNLNMLDWWVNYQPQASSQALVQACHM